MVVLYKLELNISRDTLVPLFDACYSVSEAESA